MVRIGARHGVAGRLFGAFVFAAAAAAGWGAPAAAEGTVIHVFKTPWCGCCTAWAERMREAGFATRSTDLEDLSALRNQAGIPEAVAGCHVASVEGYVLEGHVPAPAIEKLLAERPPVHGIAVPGMPAGSPGMGDDPSARYDVVTFGVNSVADSRVFYRAGR